MMGKQENLARPFEALKRTGWQCMACKTWNQMNRKRCWHCDSPPETRAVPDEELGGEG